MISNVREDIGLFMNCIPFMHEAIYYPTCLLQFESNLATDVGR